MTGWQVWILIWILVPPIVGLLYLRAPRITRRGLLFGIYVSAERATGDEVRRIERRYRRDIAIMVAIVVGVGLALLLPLWNVLTARWVNGLGLGWPTCLLLLLVGTQLCLQRARRMAARLADPQPPRASVAYLAPTRPGLALPLCATLVAVAAGLLCLGYGLWHYDALPEQWACRLADDGQPSGWMRRPNIAIVLPLTTMLLPGWVGAYAWLLARAKLAVRVDDDGSSLRAQERFRKAQTRFFSGLSLLVTAGLASVSIMTIRVGLHGPDGASPEVRTLATAMVLGGLVLGTATVLYLVGGVIYISARYGQGGAKLEAAASHAPLANGLADNRKWKFGFYVNREDPSLFVEERFGWGYEPNLGNPRAAVFYAGGLVVILALAAMCCWGFLM